MKHAPRPRKHSSHFNTLKARQNARNFSDDIFKCILLNDGVWIFINISLKFVPKGQIITIFEHWSRWWLGAYLATSHYLNQRWLGYRRIYASLDLVQFETKHTQGVIAVRSRTRPYITMTSWWARWRLKTLASPLFAELLVQAQIKENIKAPRHWPLCGEFTGDRRIPHTKGQ